MKKDVALPLLAVAGGAAGFLLRRWQLASAYRPELGLFTHKAPATLALIGLLAVLAAAFLLLLRKKRGKFNFLSAFGSPEAGQMTLLTSAGLLMMAAGALGIRAGLEELQIWQVFPESYPLSNPASQLVTGALCIPGGLGLVMMGKMAYRWTLSDGGCILASFPALMGVVWLFSAHLHWGTDPVLMKYGFRLAAVVLLTLTHYEAAAFLFNRPHPRRLAFFALMGTVLGLTALADRDSVFTAAALLACILSALAFSRSLLAGPWPERMPPDEDTDATEPVNDQN